ncbi:DedA family protein [Diaminobutyricimonas sp. LJ205]|uniref:DedA family protein n=1 Tax=Diaminobutyricimonas sp. LJ205 TaxID=2683590 RepID=UPI0012F4F754|nr:DedA family protein [Diaminobutyricimonas sp. LJ205]
MNSVNAASVDLDNLSGLVGIAARVIDALGEIGVGLLSLIETLFPPIPSEIVLPLAGFLAQLGAMNVWLVLAAATLGAYLGAVIFYYLGYWVGEERTIRVLSRLPLVDRDDFEKAAGWFHKHGAGAIFFGRFIPAVRSLISLPAGAARMHFGTFTVYTLAGSFLWNAALVGGGYALGTQYELIDEYAKYLDYAVYAVVAGILIWLVARAILRQRRARRLLAHADDLEQDEARSAHHLSR